MYKDIKNYEGLYQVNKNGDVYSVKRNIILKQCKDRRGYQLVGLYKNGRVKTMQVHRLVLLTFNPIDTFKYVNHINGIKDDNRLENLEWCTDSENKKHSYAMGLHSQEGENNSASKLTWDIVRKIRTLRETGLSYSKIALKFGISKGNVIAIIQEKTWKETVKP